MRLTKYEEDKILIKYVLENLHALTEMKYSGDHGAHVLLMDLEETMRLTTLTDHERFIIRELYVNHTSQTELSIKLGITRQGIYAVIDSAVSRLAKNN